MNEKIKVLAYCESPSITTGFGNVARHIFDGLYANGNYEIDVLGIGYYGHPYKLPYTLHPVSYNAKEDPLGRQIASEEILKRDFDILFLLNDLIALETLKDTIFKLKATSKKFKSIAYYPVDSVVKPEWTGFLNNVDYPVAYCEYGKRETLKVINREDIEIINHGVNIEEFYPICIDERDEFRKRVFGDLSDNFIISNINRNQPRKDIPRTIKAFKNFKEIVPNSTLYLHMHYNDPLGYNLINICKYYGMTKKDVVFPNSFDSCNGCPISVLNKVYNASDVVISTTMGEGFGLSWLEAMAAKRVVIMPSNTVMPEFITEDKGYLVKSGDNDNLRTFMITDRCEVERCLTNVDDMVSKLLHVYSNKEESEKKAEAAYNWVINNMTWNNHIIPKWINVFNKASKIEQNRNKEKNHG